MFTADTNAAALGFTIGDPVYYAYSDAGPGNTCGNQPSRFVYYMRAIGDLDGDTVLSTFELAVGADADNQLYRAPGFFVVNELE